MPTTIIIWPVTVSKVRPLLTGRGDSSGKVGRRRQPFFVKHWFEGTWSFDIKPEEEAISPGTFTKLYKDPESDGLGYNNEPNPRHPVKLDIPILSHFMLFTLFKNVCQTEIIIIFGEISTQCGVRFWLCILTGGSSQTSCAVSSIRLLSDFIQTCGRMRWIKHQAWVCFHSAPGSLTNEF